MAGILTVVMKNAAIIVNILALGNSTKYAPNTPEIAPDAPIAGQRSVPPATDRADGTR